MFLYLYINFLFEKKHQLTLKQALTMDRKPVPTHARSFTCSPVPFIFQFLSPSKFPLGFSLLKKKEKEKSHKPNPDG